MTELSLADLLPRLERLAQSALPLWDLPADAHLTLINVSENVTYRVDAAGGTRAVLRVHRAGYHTRAQIESELAWMEALEAEGGVPTAPVIAGRDGGLVQSAQGAELEAARFMVLFGFVEGCSPDESCDMAAHFRELGAIAAQCHAHVCQWQRPDGFERLAWDTDAVFGPDAIWGDWRAAPHVTEEIRAVLEQVEEAVRTRLARFGQREDRYGLIHADMRLANLLVGPDGTRLIDFDDCGSGWFLYDFAAAISFIEDDPRVPAMKAAWVAGYRSVRPLTADDVAEMDTFVMLRRLALLAWIGSHIEAPEPQALASDFAAVSAKLGAAWLEASMSRERPDGV